MRLKAVYFIIAFLLSFTGYSTLTYAQSLCSNGKGFLPIPAPGAKITSNLGPRDCAGCSSNHPGTDYGTSCGTKLPLPPSGCVQSGSKSGVGDDVSGSYGNYLQFDCGTNSAGETIRLQYAHLTSGTIVNNRIVTGQSGSGGCHLDYIITVNSQTIDAQCSTGTVTSGVYTYGNSSKKHGHACPISGQPNLCDPSVTAQLVDHGRKARSGVTEGPNIAGGSGGTPPSPPDGPTGGGGSSGGGSGGGGATGAGGSGGGGGGTPTRPNIGGGTSINDRTPDAVRPPYKFPDADADLCDTPTCLTNTMLDLANQADVMQDAITTKFLNIAGDGKCLPASATGNIVVRQGDGKTETYSDRFCMNKGCSFVEGSGCQ